MNFFASPFTPAKLPRKPRTHSAKSATAFDSPHVARTASAARARSASVAPTPSGSPSGHIAAGSPHADASGCESTSSCHDLMNFL